MLPEIFTGSTKDVRPAEVMPIHQDNKSGTSDLHLHSYISSPIP